MYNPYKILPIVLVNRQNTTRDKLVEQILWAGVYDLLNNLRLVGLFLAMHGQKFP